MEVALSRVGLERFKAPCWCLNRTLQQIISSWFSWFGHLCDLGAFCPCFQDSDQHQTSNNENHKLFKIVVKHRTKTHEKMMAFIVFLFRSKGSNKHGIHGFHGFGIYEKGEGCFFSHICQIMKIMKPSCDTCLVKVKQETMTTIIC